MQLELPASSQSTRELRSRLEALCESNAVAPAVQQELAVAVTEAFTNAVRHGSVCESDQIRVEVRVVRGTLKVRLVYPGQPFEPNAASLPDQDSVNGRGRFLMQRFCDDVSYSFDGGLTQVDLIRRGAAPRRPILNPA